ncbi:DUF4164 family protein [Rhodobacteraceae bacterium RKSG542]|uniref:DUF4164 domain-containing protein n=1 Tax=Pseudovibrio flavus TaxID=2529854 RepID=UPI0012BC6DC4|nr:DUF4164 domain-containing protein [Pseudovibrio flavus]MTI16589.1 DUF4164 family protein [Pseudovibrio flavus]
METEQKLDDALGRLSAAIGKLEGVAHQRMNADKSMGVLEKDLQRLGEDRSQLAATLDDAEARAEKLETVNKEVSKRLVAAMETIRTVLDKQGS